MHKDRLSQRCYLAQMCTKAISTKEPSETGSQTMVRGVCCERSVSEPAHCVIHSHAAAGAQLPLQITRCYRRQGHARTLVGSPLHPEPQTAGAPSASLITQHHKDASPSSLNPSASLTDPVRSYLPNSQLDCAFHLSNRLTPLSSLKSLITQAPNHSIP